MLLATENLYALDLYFKEYLQNFIAIESAIDYKQKNYAIKI
jgi:hypothetical protein